MFLRREMYLSITIDRELNKVIFIVNGKGGVDIENGKPS